MEGVSRAMARLAQKRTTQPMDFDGYQKTDTSLYINRGNYKQQPTYCLCKDSKLRREEESGEESKLQIALYQVTYSCLACLDAL